MCIVHCVKCVRRRFSYENPYTNQMTTIYTCRWKKRVYAVKKRMRALIFSCGCCCYTEALTCSNDEHHNTTTLSRSARLFFRRSPASALICTQYFYSENVACWALHFQNKRRKFGKILTLHAKILGLFFHSPFYSIATKSLVIWKRNERSNVPQFKL